MPSVSLFVLTSLVVMTTACDSIYVYVWHKWTRIVIMMIALSLRLENRIAMIIMYIYLALCERPGFIIHTIIAVGAGLCSCNPVHVKPSVVVARIGRWNCL